MTLTERYASDRLVYHVLNGGMGRMTLFEEDADYREFLRVVGETFRLVCMPICGYCAIPNHTGTFCSGRWVMTIFPVSCSGLPTRTSNGDNSIATASAAGMSIRADSSRFPSRRTITTIRYHVTPSEMPCGPRWSSGPKTGAGRAFRQGDPWSRTKLGR